MKWKYFLLTWLLVFLLAPSIGIHRIFMFQTPPPGSDLTGPPLFYTFGGIRFLGEMFGQLFRGDFADSLAIFVVLILPILFYTFVISLVVYYLGRYILRKKRDRREKRALTTP
jgi:hypothetical protein